MKNINPKAEYFLDYPEEALLFADWVEDRIPALAEAIRERARRDKSPFRAQSWRGDAECLSFFAVDFESGWIVCLWWQGDKHYQIGLPDRHGFVTHPPRRYDAMTLMEE